MNVIADTLAMMRHSAQTAIRDAKALQAEADRRAEAAAEKLRYAAEVNAAADTIETAVGAQDITSS